MIDRFTEQIEKDVLSDWQSPKDQATIRRRHKTKQSDQAIIASEIQLRIGLTKMKEADPETKAMLDRLIDS